MTLQLCERAEQTAAPRNDYDHDSNQTRMQQLAPHSNNLSVFFLANNNLEYFYWRLGQILVP
jgi:hypothetical protein